MGNQGIAINNEHIFFWEVLCDIQNVFFSLGETFCPGAVKHPPPMNPIRPCIRHLTSNISFEGSENVCLVHRFE